MMMMRFSLPDAEGQLLMNYLTQQSQAVESTMTMMLIITFLTLELPKLWQLWYPKDHQVSLLMKTI
jgi:hypothetical protein